VTVAGPSRNPAPQLTKCRSGFWIRGQRALDAVERRLTLSGEKLVECVVRKGDPSISRDNRLRVRRGVERLAQYIEAIG
jgi:hypothetical protein